MTSKGGKTWENALLTPSRTLKARQRSKCLDCYIIRTESVNMVGASNLDVWFDVAAFLVMVLVLDALCLINNVPLRLRVCV